MKGLITVIKEGGRCIFFLSQPPKKLVSDDFTEKGKTIANLLVDVSGLVWNVTYINKNLIVERCLLGES